jgi:hypothetical protein
MRPLAARSGCGTRRRHNTAAGLQRVHDRGRARHGDPRGGTGQGGVDGGADAGLLIVLATSSRVAPGLLSWDAWEALRSARVVLAPGHPALPALEGVGIFWPGRGDDRRGYRRARIGAGRSFGFPGTARARCCPPGPGSCAVRLICRART